MDSATSNDLRSKNHVYHELKASLIKQRFKPGERLMIAELADRFGVSTTPVREALSRLREEMLISFVHGRGYFSGNPSISELVDLYQLLEVLLVFAAKKVIGDGHHQEFDRAVERFLKAEETLRQGGGTELGGARASLVEGLYKEMIELSANASLPAIVENVIARTHFARAIVLEKDEKMAHFRTQTEAVQQAFRQRDPEKAETCVGAWFVKPAQYLSDIIKESITRMYVD